MPISVSPWWLGPRIMKTEALSKSLSRARRSMSSPVKNSSHPLAAVVLISLVGFAFGRSDFSNVAHLPPNTVKAIDEDIYRQVCSAASSDDADGVARVYVPRWDTVDNWPLAAYGGSHFSSALYAHGIIDRKIKVELVPSLEKNDEFAVDANGKTAI